MTASSLILLIPDKPDSERDALANAWGHCGGTVMRLGRFWDPPALDTNVVRVYGSTSFALVLKEKLGLSLCTPADDLILHLPFEAVKRRIRANRLVEAKRFQYPLFVKPLVPKLFEAQVYLSADDLQRACQGLGNATTILTSEIVTFLAEARAFILDGEVLDCALYEGDGDVHAAHAAAVQFARFPVLPRTLALDVGFVEGRGWAVIEMNAAWGAGLNGCQAERIWPCIAAASGAAPALVPPPRSTSL